MKLFTEQMKRHRLNKIKSKAYHRIRKKQKLHLLKKNGGEQDGNDGGDGGDSDQELTKEENEKESMRRIEERMNMKHKNTGRQILLFV